ncbi:MAG: hypothetical protein JW812_02015 [Alphaproteobacteria bacterium]|nr:hypothetical protein [Alphaproteobacteria bacterium]MBN2779689.1 hypothetical protein [Alphaproteobacteria bacterium]
MKKILAPLFVVLLAACSSTYWSEEKKGFESFRDIPIPAYSYMDKKETSIVNHDDIWLGVLKFAVSNTVPVMFDYYQKEMKRFGWKQLTFSKEDYDNYTLIFMRKDRIAHISFMPHPIDGTHIKFVMSEKSE